MSKHFILDTRTYISYKYCRPNKLVHFQPAIVGRTKVGLERFTLGQHTPRPGLLTLVTADCRTRPEFDMQPPSTSGSVYCDQLMSCDSKPERHSSETKTLLGDIKYWWPYFKCPCRQLQVIMVATFFTTQCRGLPLLHQPSST